MSNPWDAPEGERRADPASPPGPPTYGQPSYNQPSYGQPAYGQSSPNQPYGQPGYGTAAPETDQNAIIALVCAFLAWAICPIVLAIVALVFARKAESSIAASGGMKTGDGLAKAARIISWIHLALFGTILVLALVFIVIAAASA